MTEDNHANASHRGRAALLAIFALLWLGVAIWTMAKGNPLEAAGYSLVATLATVAALLVSNPNRPRTTQRRLFLTAMALVPITLGAVSYTHLTLPTILLV